MQTLIDSLNKHITLTPGDRAVVESLFTPRKFRKNQYILQEGEIARHETFLINGLARTYELDDKGQEHVVQFAIEGWWTGDLFSLLTNSPTQFNIDCLENTEVVQITKPNLEILYDKVPKMERYFRIIIQNAFVSSTQRVADTLSKTAGQRYRDFIEKYPNIESRIPNHQIASYLGITPQSLSRIRSQAAG